MAEEVRTFQEIITDVLRRGKIATSITTADSNAVSAIRGFLNQRYDQVAFARKWHWREDTRLLTTTAEYNTGTVSVTDGQRRVTLSAAATISTEFEGRYFKVDGTNEWYEIISVSSVASRTLELAAPYIGATNATATYQIARNKYGLWPDFADIYDVTLFQRFTHNPLIEKSTEDMTTLLAQYPDSEDTYPVYYSIGDVQDYNHGPTMGNNFIMGYDFMGEPETPALIFFPRLFSETVLEIKYGRQIIKLNANTDEPWIPREKRVVLVFGALADWFATQRNNNAFLLWDKKFENYLGAMKADFDKTTSRAQLSPAGYYRVRERELNIYPVTYRSSS